jgi:glycosyltransferase involved in cell wall biosynthesis
MAQSMESLIPKDKIEILRSPAIKTIPNYFQKRSGWIFAGRLSKEKGIINLIKSWPKKERLDIAGDGPLKSQISELIQELNNINLIGVYPPGDNSIFSKYEGMIFASTWLEGSPLVVADCLGTGTPVICTDQSGASEQVKIADGGVIIKGVFTTENINEAILNIRKNSEFYSQNALNSSLTIFAVKTWSEKLEKIILNV